ncbi:sugar phosphate permease [Diaminobutyricimonas aerilata]|uniref:Sugar phosphate permease n=1 Tax=Diaminobutyricimonas aerilata TaxID=1162967 RepID=A0A2M9CJP7_9MICO|nr:MFS transporter [Diaminobutyricimonas aerilata]PJJ72123.1 sugar phosphate permease [Diaminobutyricimonas aerilata]
MNSARAWVVYGVAVFAYVTAVLQRTTLGVSGVQATDRFSVDATTLSSLTVAQLVVYAGLQIPVGVLLDRVGPRVLIAGGAVLMAAGQSVLGLAPDIGLAVLGRILVGAGDAMTFISVIRLLPSWFDGRVLPQVSQWTGTVGQFGQVLSALPFALLLHDLGWSAAFLSAGALAALSAVLVLLLVDNGREVPAFSGPITLPTKALTRLRDALGRPGTQLGFWSHYVTQSSGTMLTLLWGFPFLSVALGYGASGASAMLMLIVVGGVLSGPVLGLLTARFPMRRSNIVLGIVAAMGVAWAIVLAWPGRPPLWAVILLFVTVAVGGPGSLIGFDFARTFNPLRSLGSANGVVNVGGFLASFVMMFLVGLVLDGLDRAAGGSGAPEELYSFDHFRLAFLVQYVIVGIGVVFLVSARRRTRRKLHEEEGIEVAPIWVALMRRWRRRSAG